MSREAKTLKQRIETLEKENTSLKKSLFDLSIRYNANLSSHSKSLFSLASLDVPLLHEAFMDPLLTLMPPAAALAVQNVASPPAPDFSASPASNASLAVDSVEPFAGGVKNSGRGFVLKQELQGHVGAVYCVQFSPCGKFVASGSFDKTVKVWDVSGQTETQTLKKHSLNVSDLGWYHDSTELISGAYDQTCKIWDVENGKLVDSIDCDGFVQSVMFHPTDKSLIFHGTSRNVLGMVDRRSKNSKSGKGAVTIKNESMINSLYVYRDGVFVLTADSQGYLKTWDIRNGKCVHVNQNSQSKTPISHIALCYSSTEEEEPRMLAVNSYDNVMRVYERGFTAPKYNYKVLHALKGHKNKNWPIKSSFYYSRDPLFSKRHVSHDDLYASSDVSGEVEPEVVEKEKLTGSTTLLATGSADPYVHVYNVSGGEGTSELLQRLEGHTDRVYAVNFHPTEPVLVSCSADFTVRLWTLPNGSRKKA
ncbi:hypothetical protein HK096_011003 [Nowakowskiella sp. JEL0078]|nr:hypothetical protein HK096_011003 [Nowakowskiella sp. JEL0078]